MNRPLLLASAVLFAAPLLVAQSPDQPPPTPPPVIVQVTPRALPAVGPQSTQRVYGPSSDTLIARQTADGILEDPVTGSAHCALGPYWSERLKKPVLTAFQASKRGGFLLVRPKGARVEVGGRAVTAWSGSLA